jgi:hypothetical protein
MASIYVYQKVEEVCIAPVQMLQHADESAASMLSRHCSTELSVLLVHCSNDSSSCSRHKLGVQQLQS